MSFKIEAKGGLPVPTPIRKGEDSEYAKEMLKLSIGQYFEFDPSTAEGKKVKYTANKLQKDGRARFTFRTGKNGDPSRIWRVALEPKSVATEPEAVEATAGE
jgi:hypothetical protein